mgnify:CR=1 FL=1
MSKDTQNAEMRTFYSAHVQELEFRLKKLEDRVDSYCEGPEPFGITPKPHKDWNEWAINLLVNSSSDDSSQEEEENEKKPFRRENKRQLGDSFDDNE